MTEQPEQTDNPEAEEHTGLKESLTTVFRERAFFYVLLVLLVVLTLFLVWPFLSAILLGLAAVVITRPVYDWFLEKRWVRGRTMWAVALTIVASLLLIAIPATIFIGIAVNQAMSMFEALPPPPGSLSISALQESYDSLLQQFMGDTPPDLSILEQLQFRHLSDTVTEWLSEIVIAIGLAVPSFLVNGVIVLAIMMVLLPIYRQPNRGSVAAIIPFPDSITNLYLDKVQAMMRSMFLGTFVIAFAQGAAMGIVLWIAGVPNSVFLALVSMVLSLLPVIGVSLVAWPAALLLLLSGQIWQAIFVIVMLIAVVGNIDAVLRPMLVPREAYLNPALTLLSIFGGLQLLGLVGALYGPVIMILLVTSIEVYAKYIMRGDLAPYLDDEGALSLEKLGLTPTAEERVEQSGLAGMVNRTLGRVWSRPANADATTQDAPDDVAGS